MNLIVYIRDKKFYLYSSGETKIQGIFENSEDTSDFFAKNKVNNLTLIFSRPLIFIRTLDFPFSNLSKISQVLPEESSALFPVPTEELELFWYPISREKTKTTVLILGIEKKRIEEWQKMKSSFKFSMKIGFEPFVLMNYLSKTISDRRYLLVFIDGNYIARYRVENNAIVEGSSSFFEPGSLEDTLNEIKSEETNLPLVLVGDITTSKNISGFRVILPKKSESCISIFLALFENSQNLSVSPNFKIFTVRYSEITVNPLLILVVCVYLCLAGIMFRPVLISKQYQEKVNSVNKKMEEVFKSAFPNVSRIVNPIIQAKEHLKNFQDVQQIMPKISVISIMSTISRVVPENVPFKVSQMSLRGNDLFLTCLTDTLENVEIISQIFKKADLFSSVKVGGIAPESGQITFNLLMKVKID